MKDAKEIVAQYAELGGFVLIEPPQLEHLIRGQRQQAAESMRERCAQIMDRQVKRWGDLEIKRRNGAPEMRRGYLEARVDAAYLAKKIRALPLDAAAARSESSEEGR